MKRAPHIPQEIAGLVDIVLERLLADALAEQRQEQRPDARTNAAPTNSRPAPARAAEQR